jgi:hypothetical protein
MIQRLAIILPLLVSAAGAFATPACTATSGAHTTALVELYTSEGCSSCPPADAWLSKAGRARRSADEFVPLALHVPYWDYLGWRDAYAQQAFSARQSRLVGANGHRTSYTPQIFVSGIDARRYGAEEEIRRIDAQPAAARITLRTALARPDTLAIDAEATMATDSTRAAALYLAVTEDGLVSSVAAGENRGATLRQDYVVRRLLGPLALRDGRLAEHVTVPVDSAWRLDRLGVAAFVEDAAGGRVLQAVSTASCRPGG